MLEFAVFPCRDTAKTTVKSSRSHPLSRNLTETQPSATAEVYHAAGPNNAVYGAMHLLLWPRRAKFPRCRSSV